MAFSQNLGREQSSTALRRNDLLTLGLIGMGVIFASLGLGEAVYRFTFCAGIEAMDAGTIIQCSLHPPVETY